MEYVLNGALAGLRRFDLSCLPTYKAALNRTARLCGQQYFPYLFFYYGIGSRKDLLFEEVDGSACLYRIEESDDGMPYLVLFFLPFPMQIGVLKKCLERVREFNRQPRVVIYWVGEEDIGGLSLLWAEVRAYPIFREYLYAPGIYRSLAGKATRNLRRNLEKIIVRDDVEVRAFAAADSAACLALLDEWAELQKDKYDGIYNRRYTRNCIKYASFFEARDLFGKVVLIDGEIRSFGFAGEIHKDLASLFIVYSDLTIKGLNQFLNYQLLLDLEAYKYVNSGMAHTPGLQFAKEALCPVGTHGMYRVLVNPSA